jgi:nucleoid-associated protein YgaU
LIIPDVADKREEIQSLVTSVEKKPENDKTVNIITHTVQSGDTLYRIAEKYYGDHTMWKKIYVANEGTMEDQDTLRKGQILIIPQ